MINENDLEENIENNKNDICNIDSNELIRKTANDLTDAIARAQTKEELEELCEFAYDMYIEVDIDDIYTITNTIIELTLSNSIENILNMSIEEFEEEITF